MQKAKIPNELKNAGEVVVEDLNTRVVALEEKFGDNEKIAKTLCIVSDNIKDFDKLFEKALLTLMENPNVKQAFNKAIDESDRSTVKKLLKRFGVWIGWLISIIITAYIATVIK